MAATKRNVPSKLVRGAALIEKILAHLVGPDSPIGDPQPLDAASLRAVEDAVGVALSPSLHAVLSFDAGWLQRRFHWFDDAGRLLARPARDLMHAHAGDLGNAYDGIGKRRFPGKALPGDEGSDSMRLVYFGDPDEHGEYPVLLIDHDDVPLLGVAWPGVDVWLAAQLGLVDAKAYKAETLATQERLLGSKKPWEWRGSDAGLSKLPAPIAGPTPGSVKHASFAPPPRKPAKKLTEKQLEKALLEHAEKGNLIRLRELVADVAARGLPKTWYDWPLFEAASAGHEDATRLLLDAGANPNVAGRYGCVLAACNEPKIMRALLDAGADPNGPWINGKTAIFHAVDRGAVDLVNLLLDAGANPLHEDKNGMTAVHDAANERNTLEVLEVLLNRGGSPDAGKSHSRPLHWAVEKGNLDHARCLIAHGADLNARSDYLKRTALHIAFGRGDDAFAAELVRAGADRTLVDERGISLEKVYGPAGEDVRTLDVLFAPSAEPQTLTIELELAVLDKIRLQSSWTTHHDASFWAEVVSTGLAAGAAFDPAKSRAKVIEPLELKKIAKVGPAKRRFVLEVAAVGPELLHVLARTLLRPEMAFRVTGLSLRGSRAEGAAVDTTTLRRMLDDAAWAPLAREGDLPFAFRVAKGAPSVVIKASGKLGPKQEELAQLHVDRWFRVLEAFRVGSRWSLVELRSKNALNHRIVADAVGDEPKGVVFPFSTVAAAALLRNSMRALAAKVPLEEVVLTMPA